MEENGKNYIEEGAGADSFVFKVLCNTHRGLSDSSDISSGVCSSCCLEKDRGSTHGVSIHDQSIHSRGRMEGIVNLRPLRGGDGEVQLVGNTGWGDSIWKR